MSRSLDQLRAELEPHLTCWFCDAVNRPGVIVIHIDTETDAACDECGKGGPIDKFRHGFLREGPGTSTSRKL